VFNPSFLDIILG